MIRPRLCVCLLVCIFVHKVRERGIEWENLLFPSPVSVKTGVEVSDAGDACMRAHACTSVSVQP